MFSCGRCSRAYDTVRAAAGCDHSRPVPRCEYDALLAMATRMLLDHVRARGTTVAIEMTRYRAPPGLRIAR